MRIDTVVKQMNGDTMEMAIDVNDVEYYYSGASVEESFPYLTSKEQQFLDNGFLPEDWNKATPASVISSWS